MGGKPLETGVDLEGIARRTPGFSGASLQNLLNEAAINAARKAKTAIGYDEIDAAVDRQLVGKEKKDVEQSEQRRKLVAYHEAGHAVAGAMIPDYDMIQKITIVPRTNGAGGLTFFSPDEGRLNSGMYSQQYLQGQLAVALSGVSLRSLSLARATLPPEHPTTCSKSQASQAAWPSARLSALSTARTQLARTSSPATWSFSKLLQNASWNRRPSPQRSSRSWSWRRDRRWHHTSFTASARTVYTRSLASS